MKRLFSKKSGFTLVEIIIAFAVFAVMASMLVQILNLTINRKNENLNYEKYLQDQEKTLVANGQKWNAYDESAPIDGTLDLKFKDKDGTELDMSLEYQLVNVDGTLNDASGINYFVGDIDYAEGGEGVVGGEDKDPNEDKKDEAAIGGSSQMSRFDTRLTGTKGISSIVINATPTNATKDEYEITVTVNDSGVDEKFKKHTQVTMFFGEGVSGGKLANIVSITSEHDAKYVKRSGLNGINVHNKPTNGNEWWAGTCEGFKGSAITFTVKFDAPIENLSFGDNVTGGNTYTEYKGYVNIFGAYEKAS